VRQLWGNFQKLWSRQTPIPPRVWNWILLCGTGLVIFVGVFLAASNAPQAPLFDPTSSTQLHLQQPSSSVHGSPIATPTTQRGTLASVESSARSSEQSPTSRSVPTTATTAAPQTTKKIPPGQGGPIPSQPHPTKTTLESTTTTTQEETSSSSTVTEPMTNSTGDQL
jgi:hypothetical protein